MYLAVCHPDTIAPGQHSSIVSVLYEIYKSYIIGLFLYCYILEWTRALNAREVSWRRVKWTRPSWTSGPAFCCLVSTCMFLSWLLCSCVRLCRMLGLPWAFFGPLPGLALRPILRVRRAILRLLAPGPETCDRPSPHRRQSTPQPYAYWRFARDSRKGWPDLHHAHLHRLCDPVPRNALP